MDGFIPRGGGPLLKKSNLSLAASRDVRRKAASRILPFLLIVLVLCSFAFPAFAAPSALDGGSAGGSARLSENDITMGLVNSGTDQVKARQEAQSFLKNHNGIGPEKVTDPALNSKKTQQNLLEEGDKIADAENGDDDLGAVGKRFANFLDAQRETMNSFNQISQIVAMNPKDYNAGAWNFAQNVMDAFLPLGITFCLIFFVFSYMRSLVDEIDGSRAFSLSGRLLLRLFLAFAVVMNAQEICNWLLEFSTGLVNKITGAPAAWAVKSPQITQLQNIADKQPNMKFENLHLYLDLLLAKYGVKIMMFATLVLVVARFFKIYLYIAISPLPLAGFAGRNTQQLAVSFLKTLFGVLLEGLVIVMSIRLFSTILFDPTTGYPKLLLYNPKGTDDIVKLFNYIDNVLLNLLICSATVFGADRLVSRVFGTSALLKGEGYGH